MHYVITSASNEKVKRLRTLDFDGGVSFMAEGEHLTQEALKAGADIRGLYYSSECAGKYAEAVSLAQGCGIDTFELSREAFARINKTVTPQGICCEVFKQNTQSIPHMDSGIAVALDGVQDPGNVGTIMRTALAVGAGFVLSGADSASFYNPKTVRASMGAVFHLPLIRSECLSQSIKAMRGMGWQCICAHLKGTDFFARPREKRELLVIGSEGAGVSAEVAEQCTGLYRLQMDERSESLNASVAAGIMLYDLYRTR